MLRQRSRLAIVIKVGGASLTRCCLADAYTVLMAAVATVEEKDCRQKLQDLCVVLKEAIHEREF